MIPSTSAGSHSERGIDADRTRPLSYTSNPALFSKHRRLANTSIINLEMTPNSATHQPSFTSATLPFCLLSTPQNSSPLDTELPPEVLEQSNRFDPRSPLKRLSSLSFTQYPVSDSAPTQPNTVRSASTRRSRRGRQTRVRPAVFCEHCNRSFFKPSDLARHVRTHTGEKPFKCELCGRTFRIKTTLQMHYNTHKSPVARDRFKCSVCGLLCSARSSLAIHVKLHEDPNPYECNQCDAKFVSSQRRAAHMKEQHGLCGRPGRPRPSAVVSLNAAAAAAAPVAAAAAADVAIVSSSLKTLSPEAADDAALIDSSLAAATAAVASTASTTLSIPSPAAGAGAERVLICRALRMRSVCEERSARRGVGHVTLVPLHALPSLPRGHPAPVDITPTPTPTSTRTRTPVASSTACAAAAEAAVAEGDEGGSGPELESGACGSGSVIGIDELTVRAAASASECASSASSTQPLDASASPHTAHCTAPAVASGESEEAEAPSHIPNSAISIVIHTLPTNQNLNQNQSFDRSNQCSVCGKAFPTNIAMLKRHMLTHTGDKPYKCDHCGKSFGQKAGLNRHAILHTATNSRVQYQCSQCAFSTIHRGNLYAHERHRHPPPVLLAARTGTGTAAVRTLPQVQPHPTTTPSHTRSALTSVSASPFASAFGALPQAVTGSALLLGRSGAPALPADVKADADVLAAPSAAIEAPFASDSPAPLGPSHLDDPFAQLAHFFS